VYDTTEGRADDLYVIDNIMMNNILIVGNNNVINNVMMNNSLIVGNNKVMYYIFGYRGDETMR